MDGRGPRRGVGALACGVAVAAPASTTALRSGLRKRISRVFVISRNDSETVSPSNIRMMSRLTSTAWRARDAGYARCLRFLSSTTRNACILPGLRDGGEEPHQRAAGLEQARHLAREHGAGACPDSRRCPSRECRRSSRRPAGSACSRNAASSLVRLFRELLEVRVDVLDEELAAEAFAEKVDVGADDRAEVEQDRRLAVRQRRQELAEGLGRQGLPLVAVVVTVCSGGRAASSLRRFPIGKEIGESPAGAL